LQGFTNGAHRASRQLRAGRALVAAAIFLGLSGLIAAPPASAATGMKVVIVVGPTESGTAHNIASAQELAAQARGYGATVIEIYSPNATWSRVRSAAQGANVFIYMGHGNGWPSPYKPFTSKTKDGLGLNATANAGNSNTRHYGEWYLTRYIHLAPNAVVILRGLCYSAGNSEPGKANPSVATGQQRIDNYAAGFLRTGAKAVFAEPYGGVGYILDAIFQSDRTVRDIFSTGGGWGGGWGSGGAWSDGWGAGGGGSSGLTSTSFASVRTGFATVISDRDASGRFRRSVVGNLDLTATSVRQAGS
jgi:hypothetical protein